MQKKVLKNLILIAACGVVVSNLLLFAVQTYLAQNSAFETISQRFTAVAVRYAEGMAQQEALVTALYEDRLARARALSALLEQDSGVLLDEAMLALGADEYRVTGADGRVEMAYPAHYINTYWAEFDEILTDAGAEIVLEAAGEETAIFAGVARRDSAGIVVVGVYGGSDEILGKNGVSTILGGAAVGNTGYFFSVSEETSTISYHPNPLLIDTAFELENPANSLTINGEKALYHAESMGGHRVYAVLPESEVYFQRNLYCFTFAGFTILLFAALCGIVMLYLRRIVISGIHSVLDVLDSIAKQDFSKAAQIRSSPELSKLSDSINSMRNYIKNDIAHTKILLEQLERAKQKAEDASRSKTAFLANMSHEIRTPMNGIIGFSELALEETHPAAIGEYFQNINISTKGLLGIVNDILDISKIEAGELIMDTVPFSILETFEVCRTVNLPKAQEKGVDLVFDINSIGMAAEKLITGDPTKLRQVLINLISNSIKFTEKGSVTLTVRTLYETRDSIRLDFVVNDTGVGMSEVMLKNLFEPFAQESASTARLYGGSGLGMPITRGIIERAGGKLTVKSDIGRGTRFSFFGDFGVTEIPISERISESRGENYGKRPVFEGEVLVFEDNDINQQVIAEHLRRIGLVPVIAENGLVGVQIAERYKTEGRTLVLVLMDIHMPVMDGYEAAGRLREMECSSPIIAMTANAMTESYESCMKYGMQDYIVKPFTTRELWRCLLRHLIPAGFSDELAVSVQAAYPVRASDGVILNEAAGIERSAGSPELYAKLKHDFLRSGGRFDELSVALDEGDMVTAHRLMHTLKGSAGLLCAPRLQEAAKHAEHLLKEKIADPHAVAQVERELMAVLDFLREQEPQVENSPKISGGETPDEIIEQLEQLLEAGNAECLTLAASLAGARYDALVRLVEDYEFDSALAELRRLKSEGGA